MIKLTAPCNYQGNKSHIAGDIIDIIQPDPKRQFVDLCCGSGAITCELVNRGFPPEQITMLDIGPWGMFWRSIANGTFDMDVFKSHLDALPDDPFVVHTYMKRLAAMPIGEDAVYVFLILQAASFGSRAIWIDGRRWCHYSFRAARPQWGNHYPMVPIPPNLYSRVRAVHQSLSGRIHAVRLHIAEFDTAGVCIYVDPPYSDTTGYKTSLDIYAQAGRLAKHNTVYVSESFALTENAWEIHDTRPNRAKLNGGLVKPGQGRREFLSKF